jgi:hypothetical protein
MSNKNDILMGNVARGLGTGKSGKHERNTKQTIQSFGLAGNDFFDTASLMNYPLKNIPINEIGSRAEGNEFVESNIDNLAASIKSAGLIDPIQVLITNDADYKYRVIAGHRRLAAFRKLFNDGEAEFSTITCIIYQVTENEQLDKTIDDNKSCIYITKETEEQMYVDSNLESRQLTYSETAKFILHIIDRFENEDYYKQIVERRKANKKNDSTSVNDTDEVIRILSDYHYDGWKTSNIRRLIDIKHLSQVSSEAADILSQITDATVTINKATQQLKGKVSFYKMLESTTEKIRSKMELKYRDIYSTQDVDFDELYSEYEVESIQQAKPGRKKDKGFSKVKSSIALLDKEAKYSKNELDEIRQWVNDLTQILNNN